MLVVLGVPQRATDQPLPSVAAPRHSPPTSRASRITHPFSRYQEGEDLRAYVERSNSRLDDPQTMYYVSQALEECRTWGAMPDDDELPNVTVISHVDWRQWVRSGAAATLSAPCRGFGGRVIDSGRIFTLLQEAARMGEPHARARMLLFRDIAAPKSDVMEEIPILLATGDPQIVRDVGAFLAKGEVSLRYGSSLVDASIAVIAWELAACDLGYPCGPMSRIVLAQCAFRGYCDAYSYDDAIARDEDPERMAQAQHLRQGLVRALRRQDWTWLGFAN
jgi:hypothetical protein